MALLIILNGLFMITVLHHGTFMMYLGKFSLEWFGNWNPGNKKPIGWCPRVMFVGL